MLSKPLNKYFDHTLLKADATEEQIRTLVREALEYDFAAVCVNGAYVPLVREMLDEPGSAPANETAHEHQDKRNEHKPSVVAHPLKEDPSLRIATVVNFPLGASDSDAVLKETSCAISAGAREIDAVINLGALKSGRWDLVERELSHLAFFCHGPGCTLKVILETCLLSDEEIIQACQAAKKAGADFVKTSTGFSTGGATVHAVELMRKTLGDSMEIKASGGIRTLADAMAMIRAGADRLGCSASVRIMKEFSSTGPL